MAANINLQSIIDTQKHDLAKALKKVKRITMKRFSPDEDKYIIQNYLTQTLSEMGAVLNRHESVLSGRMKRLGLVVPEELKSQRIKKGLAAGWHKGVETRFKKGLIPHNKGKKMPDDLKRKVAHTFYPKGHIPHNALFDGAQRITFDGYIEERVSLGVWKLKHRMVWEQHHGEIPQGGVVKFKDGNRQNISIENLYLVNRQQNMKDNTIQRYPAEVKTAICRLHKLNKSIKNYETDKH